MSPTDGCAPCCAAPRRLRSRVERGLYARLTPPPLSTARGRAGPAAPSASRRTPARPCRTGDPPPWRPHSAHTPTATRRRRHKGQGQWALGHLEPLTPNERVKNDDDGLNVRARIENIYAHPGFASIDPADLRGRFRWWGLYTQRRPGIDGGKTAMLEPHELDDEFFMLRVRIDGGRLRPSSCGPSRDISQRVRPRHR